LCIYCPDGSVIAYLITKFADENKYKKENVFKILDLI
jgi:hypothetical protein